jgi:hypothetical protein
MATTWKIVEHKHNLIFRNCFVIGFLSKFNDVHKFNMFFDFSFSVNGSEYFISFGIFEEFWQILFYCYWSSTWDRFLREVVTNW